jgi:XTP/dITP diphosphohydrolase
MQDAPLRVVVATKNRGKLTELRALLEGVRVRGQRLELIGVDQAHVALPDVEETGTTYTANALLKAHAIAAKTGLATLADDSGLEVDALDGAPGVHSARYAGDAGPSANTHKLMHVMERREERAARFRCVIVFLEHPDAQPVIAEGICEGAIAHLARGAGGFGYDPVFEVAPTELAQLGLKEARTMSELSEDQKNIISHRGRAVRALRAALDAG